MKTSVGRIVDFLCLVVGIIFMIWFLLSVINVNIGAMGNGAAEWNLLKIILRFAGHAV